MRQLMKRPGRVWLMCLGLCVAAVCSESSAQSVSKTEPVVSSPATTSSEDTAKTTNRWKTRPTLPLPGQRPVAGASGSPWKTKTPSNLGKPAVPRTTAIDAAKLQYDNLQQSAIELKQETAKLQQTFDDAFRATQLLLTKSHEAEKRYEASLNDGPPDLEKGSPEELRRARLKAESTAATKLFNVAFKKETKLAGELTVKSSEADTLARKIRLSKAKLVAEVNYAAAQDRPGKPDLARRKAELDIANKALAEDAASDAENRKYEAELAAEAAREKEHRNRHRGSQKSTDEGGFKSATIVEADDETTPQQPGPIPPPIHHAARKRAGKLLNNAQELAERAKLSADRFDEIDQKGEELSGDFELAKRDYEKAVEGRDVSPEQIAKLKTQMDELSKEIDNVLRDREKHFNDHQRTLQMAEEAEQKAKQAQAGGQQAQRLKDLAVDKPRVATGRVKKQAVEDPEDLNRRKDEGVSDKESQKVLEPSTPNRSEESTHSNGRDEEVDTTEGEVEEEMPRNEEEEEDEEESSAEGDDEEMSEGDDEMSAEDEEMSADDEDDEEEMSEAVGEEDEEESSAEGDDEEMSEGDDEMSAEDEEMSEAEDDDAEMFGEGEVDEEMSGDEDDDEMPAEDEEAEISEAAGEEEEEMSEEDANFEDEEMEEGDTDSGSE